MKYLNIIGPCLAIALLFVPLAGQATETNPSRSPMAGTAEKDIPDGDFYNYVMILGYDDMIPAVQNLVNWKQSIGYTVAVVTVDDIVFNYPGDRATAIHNFLADKYSQDGWGIEYVLLVGDIDLIPMRLLFPEDDERPKDGGQYGTDYYYCKPSVSNWDSGDWDLRWGEFEKNELDPKPDIFVGRLPINNVTWVATVCNNIVAFEQDHASWKRQAVMAFGISSYNSTTDFGDSSPVAERLRDDFLLPHGFGTERLYEHGDVCGSPYWSDQLLSRANFCSVCDPAAPFGITHSSAHGDGQGMQSWRWDEDTNGNGIEDNGEAFSNDFCLFDDIPTDPASGIVYLDGCETAPLLGHYDETVVARIGSNALFSDRFPELSVRRFLRHGSPMVIGSTAGSSYNAHWSGPEDWGPETMSYHFYDNLVDNHMNVGDAFLLAQQTYAETIGPSRETRVFNCFGDPSLSLRGIENRPGGPDVIIHEGNYAHYDVDSYGTGDMFAAVLATDQDTAPAVISIYKSTDHGQTWQPYTVIEHPFAATNIQVAVTPVNYPDYGVISVFFVNSAGELWNHRVNMTNPASQHQVMIDTDIAYGATGHVSVAKNPDVTFSHIYLAYNCLDSGILADGFRIAQSMDAGAHWGDYQGYDDYAFPDISCGLTGLFVAAHSLDEDPSHISVAHSIQPGELFGLLVDVTGDDGAAEGGYVLTPSIAANHGHPDNLSIWVTYIKVEDFDGRRDYSVRCTVLDWQHGLYFLQQEWSPPFDVYDCHAYDNHIVDIAVTDILGNDWANLAYTKTGKGPDQVNIVWRYTGGGAPLECCHERIVNTYPASLKKPRIVYSAGAPASGSGVVYGGSAGINVYFSAPWLVGPKSEIASASVARPTLNPSTTFAAYDGPPVGIQPAKSDTLSDVIWQRRYLGEAAQSVTSMVALADSVFLMSAIESGGEAQRKGAVYRSENSGSTWQRLSDVGGMWACRCVLRAADGMIYAGGSERMGGGDWHGVIYRSDDNGLEWSAILNVPDTDVYDLMQAANGDLYAATGWDGEIYRASSNGLSWTPVASVGAETTVHSIIQSGAGNYYIGVGGSGAGACIMKSTDGSSYTAVTTSGPTPTTVYQLAEHQGRVYAAAETAVGGEVYASGDDAAEPWLSLSFPSQDPLDAVASLALDSDGDLYAGVKARREFVGKAAYRYDAERSGWVPHGGKIDLIDAVNAIHVGDDVTMLATGNVHGLMYWYSREAMVGVDDSADHRPPPQSLDMRIWPNPANPHVTISFVLGKTSLVDISVYDVRGRLVWNRSTEQLSAGRHEIVWDGTHSAGYPVSSGSYLVRVRDTDGASSSKVTFVK